MAADRRDARGMRLTSALLATLAVAACESPSVPTETFAYDPRRLTGGLVYHWPAGRTIAIWVDTTAQGQVNAGADPGEAFDIEQAVREGAAFWDGASHYGEFDFRFTGDPADADVVVRYRQAPRVVDDAACDAPGSGAGETIFCADELVAPVLPLLDGGGGRVKIDVLLDPLWVSDALLATHGLTRERHFVQLAAHELGHVLGIGGHSPDDEDIMYALALAGRVSAGDAATLRWVLRQEADITF